MSLHANNNAKGDFELTPAGLYVARCYRILDLGTQTITNSFGTKHQHKVMFSWELLDDETKMEDGRPFAVHKTYTLSLSDKANLRADIESWQNRELDDAELEDFDLSTLIDNYCQIQVVHSDDGRFANVQGLVTYKPLKNDKGEKIFPKAVNEAVIFDIDNPDLEVFNALSDNMKAKIMQSPEWQEQQSKASVTAKPKATKEEKSEGEKVMKHWIMVILMPCRLIIKQSLMVPMVFQTLPRKRSMNQQRWRKGLRGRNNGEPLYSPYNQTPPAASR